MCQNPIDDPATRVLIVREPNFHPTSHRAMMWALLRDEITVAEYTDTFERVRRLTHLFTHRCNPRSFLRFVHREGYVELAPKDADSPA